MIYLLIGDNDLEIQRFIEVRIKAVGEDPGLADLNLTRLDLRQSSEEDLHQSAYALPLFTDRRLVIGFNGVARINSLKDEARARWTKLLEGLPPSTDLILVLSDSRFTRKGVRDWEIYTSNHWLRKWAAGLGKAVETREMDLPLPAAMPNWIEKEAVRQGGKFEGLAAAVLFAHTGTDTRLASMEIAKLLMYVNFERAVQAEDVEKLVAQVAVPSVFALTDALAQGKRGDALHVLHQLMEEEDPLGLFGMIVRQYRLLIHAREMLDEGQDAYAVGGALRLPNRVAGDLCAQARRLPMPRLIEIYHRLLQTDQDIKTGQMEAAAALDLLVVEIVK
jgi:DNA polymerase III subunit delta